MKLNKLEMKITVAKVNFNKLLKEIQISNENKLFIIQLMKNLGFDDKDIKMIEEKIEYLIQIMIKKDPERRATLKDIITLDFISEKIENIV